MTLIDLKGSIWFKYCDIMVLYDKHGSEIEPTTHVQWKQHQRKTVSSHNITHKDELVILNVQLDI